MNNQLFVGNINFNTTEDDLRTAFAEFGDIVEVKLPLDRATGRRRGFGFVKFASADDAQKALSKNGSNLQGREIRVNLAEEKKEGGGSRGGFGGGGRGGRSGGNAGGGWRKSGGYEGGSRYED